MLDAASIAPTVTWGTTPEQAGPITGMIPTPDQIADENKAEAAREAIGYMGLRRASASTTSASTGCSSGPAPTAGSRICARPRPFSSGSALARAGPGLRRLAAIKRQAEAEGLDRIFRDAGLEWAESGCSMCVGMNGDTVPSGERCASTTNRNFKGRQGQGSRTHLMSPAMAARSY